MKKYAKCIRSGAVLATLSLLASGAQADVAVTADLGTTGVGAHIVVPMESTINGRFGINYFSKSEKRRESTIDYDAKARLQTIDILFDWYVIQNSPFHLTGGIVVNGNRIKGKGLADASGNYIIAGKTYNAVKTGDLNATVDYGNAAPYVGIGWGNALTVNKRLTFQGELGAFYQGKSKVAIVNWGCADTPARCATIFKDLATEAANLRKSVDAPSTFPVLRFSVGYKF